MVNTLPIKTFAIAIPEIGPGGLAVKHLNIKFAHSPSWASWLCNV